jgi:PAS domain S-box-containing protein
MGTEAWTPPRLGAFIRNNRAELIAEWAAEMEKLPKSELLSFRRRIDHIPQILDRIADAADADGGGTPAELWMGPDAHALQRLDEGFDLKEVVREYAVLRSVVLRRWEREVVGGAHPEEVVALDVAFDEAIAASVARYTRARDRTLIALDRIADVALDESGSELEPFLERLLHVMMETTESVDTAAIFLRDGDRLEMRAAVGLVADHAPFSVAVGEGFAGKIAAERSPLELRNAAEDTLVVSAVIRDKHIRALYGVPMMRRGEVIGVAHMGSLTAYEFANEDKVLFRTMVARATSLIPQAQLLEREAQAREQAEQALAMLDTLFHASPVGMAFLDPGFRYLRINDALAAINGRTAEEHIGRSIDEVLPNAAHILRPILQRIVETREPLADAEMEAAVPSDPDDPRTFLANYYPVVGADDRLLGVGGVVLDITERKRTQAELQREAEYRERFIAVLSHDLRNPITAITTGAQLLLRRQDLPPTSANVLRRIDASAQRMARMIGELLDFTRSRTGGGMRLQRRDSDLCELADHIVEEIAIVYPKTELRVFCAPGLRAMCDPERIGQVLSNLVSNAIRHSPPGAPVAVTLEPDGDEVVVHVHNQGKPIAPDLLPRLFDPFCQGRDRDASGGALGGLGLGLFIVKEIVTAHGGRITVDSTEETGTTFLIHIPR